MNRMRMKIASRLKEAQNTNAMLTTFNELDMSAIMQVAKFISVVYLVCYHAGSQVSICCLSCLLSCR